MNTIYYGNPSNGKRAAVKVGQPSYDLITKSFNRGAKRRATMAEADAVMYRRGYQRWPRKKPLPGEKAVR